MLKQEIIDAVADNAFAIYAVANVNEALELLTGELVGKKDKNGEYPKDSLNFKAISRLKEISDLGHDKDEDSNEEVDL